MANLRSLISNDGAVQVFTDKEGVIVLENQDTKIYYHPYGDNIVLEDKGSGSVQSISAMELLELAANVFKFRNRIINLNDFNGENVGAKL